MRLPDRKTESYHWNMPGPPATIVHMIHEHLSQSIDNLRARIIAIRDSL
jgi:hypothetical protein